MQRPFDTSKHDSSLVTETKLGAYIEMIPLSSTGLSGPWRRSPVMLSYPASFVSGSKKCALLIAHMPLSLRMRRTSLISEWYGTESCSTKILLEPGFLRSWIMSWTCGLLPRSAEMAGPYVDLWEVVSNSSSLSFASKLFLNFWISNSSSSSSSSAWPLKDSSQASKLVKVLAASGPPTRSSVLGESLASWSKYSRISCSRFSPTSMSFCHCFESCIASSICSWTFSVEVVVSLGLFSRYNRFLLMVLTESLLVRVA